MLHCFFISFSNDLVEVLKGLPLVIDGLLATQVTPVVSGTVIDKAGDFKKMAKNKAVSLKTIVFNHLVQTKAEYNDFWEVPASESWHARFFKA